MGDVMKSLQKYLKNTKILNILMALICYISICSLGILKAYDTISWLILVILILLFSKTNLENKVMKKEIIILSIIFSFITVFGNVVNNSIYNIDSSVFREFFHLTNVVHLIGAFNLIFVVLTNLLPKLYNYSATTKKSIFKNNKIIFISCLLIMLLCWLPYFLSFYPGNLSPDSITELTTVINNFTNASDHHPIIHMIFIAIPYKLMFSLTKNMIISIAFSTIIQMLVMASIFSSLIVFLHNRKVKDKLLIFILIYYAILPVFGYYSVVMWKDVIFSGLVLLLIMELIKIIEKDNKNNLHFHQLIPFIIVSILCIFFRSNAIYMYFLLVIFTFIFMKKHIKIFIGAFCIVFSVYYIIKGPVFNALNITKSSSSEYIAIPMQQIGRMAYKKVNFTNKEKKKLEKIMSIEDLAKAYNPITSDGIKFNSNYNAKAFDENKGKYFKLWLNLVKKHPSIAVEAYLISTLGYWYPGVSYNSVCFGIVEDNIYGLKNRPKLGNDVLNVLYKLESRDTPILNIEWSIGLCFWLILIFSLLACKKIDKKSLYLYVPIFGLWLTMMVAAPVYAEFRYVYSAFICLPLFMVIPYLNLKKYDIMKTRS